MLDKVRVGGIDYKVELKDLSTRKDEEEGLQLGWCVFKEDLIEINENLTTARQHQTFIHELMHAVLFEAGIEQDEDIVNRVGLIMYQVLKDNDFSWMG